MIPLYPNGRTRPVCKVSSLDAFGDHAIHSWHNPRFKYRHVHVCDILYNVIWRAGIAVKKEAPVNFLTDPRDGRSTLDQEMFRYTIGLKVMEFLKLFRQLLLQNLQNLRHKSACTTNQHSFIQFAFDMFGFLAPDTVLLKKLIAMLRPQVLMSMYLGG